MTARKHNAARFHRFYGIITRQRVCVYCGVPSTTVDHFVPLSVVAILADAISEVRGKVLVPACGECNGMAGAASFPTVAAKRRFIHDKIRRKYRKVLEAPEWRESEISELGYSMQNYVLAGLAQKQWVKDRLAWHNGRNSEAVKLAAVRSNVMPMRRAVA